MKRRKIVSTIVSILLVLSIFNPIMSVHAASSPIASGTYRIMTKHFKFVDINRGSKDNGAITHQWEFANVKSQEYKITKMKDGSYKITPVHSGKPLEVRNSSYDNGASIAQWEFVDGYDCKYWYIYDNGDGWYNIVNKNSGKYMDVSGNNSDNGTVIHQYEGNGTDAQLFAFLPTKIKQGVFESETSLRDYVGGHQPKIKMSLNTHRHKGEKYFSILVNDKAADMYWVNGWLCSCGEVASYSTMPFPN